MPRGQKLSSAERMTQLQNKINAHKSHIANLEKQMSMLQKEINHEALNELASFIEKKRLTIGDVKKLINQSSVTPKASAKTSTKTSTKTTANSSNTDVRPNA